MIILDAVETRIVYFEQHLVKLCDKITPDIELILEVHNNLITLVFEIYNDCIESLNDLLTNKNISSLSYPAIEFHGNKGVPDINWNSKKSLDKISLMLSNFKLVNSLSTEQQNKSGNVSDIKKIYKVLLDSIRNIPQMAPTMVNSLQSEITMYIDVYFQKSNEPNKNFPFVSIITGVTGVVFSCLGYVCSSSQENRWWYRVKDVESNLARWIGKSDNLFQNFKLKFENTNYSKYGIQNDASNGRKRLWTDVVKGNKIPNKILRGNEPESYLLKSDNIVKDERQVTSSTLKEWKKRKNEMFSQKVSNLEQKNSKKDKDIPKLLLELDEVCNSARKLLGDQQ